MLKCLWCLSLALAVACGTDSLHELPDASVPLDGGADAGTHDAGPADAGHSDAGSSDAGANDAGSSDAGTPDAGTGLTAVSPSLGDRRGPILLYFTLNNPSGAAYTFALEHAESGTFAPATTRSITQAGDTVLAVWDSFADVSANVASTARLTATSSSGALTASVSVSLKNNPETDRLILVGHSLLEDARAPRR
jgi:hypothetical protein